MKIMGKKVKEIATVIEQKELAPGIFSMVLETSLAQWAKPGQFVNLYCQGKEALLPRPISICEIDKSNHTLRMVYRIAGKGTKEFSSLGSGDTIEIFGPLGNGFLVEDKKVMVVGGGIGVPPMLQLAKECGGEVCAVLGYRNQQTFLLEEFKECTTKVVVATDDGSLGYHGTVVDAMRAENLVADVIYACGPKPMLAGIKAYAMEHDILCYVSMEERMACGVGACLACVCESTQKDEHSNVTNKRVCKDGPVFLATEVEL